MTVEQALVAEIETLDRLDLCQLRRRWQELHDAVPPKRVSRQLLVQSIAYKIQVQAYGGLAASMRKRLASKETGLSLKLRRAINRRYKPGTEFLREWQGRTHRVTAAADGKFHYQDKTYRSLSMVARAIAGTHWSGPAFFGLNDKKEGIGGQTAK